MPIVLLIDEGDINMYISELVDICRLFSELSEESKAIIDGYIFEDGFDYEEDHDPGDLVSLKKFLEETLELINDLELEDDLMDFIKGIEKKLMLLDLDS